MISVRWTKIEPFVALVDACPRTDTDEFTLSRALLEPCGIQCGMEDVIQSGGPGCRFHKWIVVRDGEADKASPGDNGRAAGIGNMPLGHDVTVNVTDGPAALTDGPDDTGRGTGNVPDHLGLDTDSRGPAATRRQWIMDQWGKGRPLKVRAIAEELGVCERTVKRELGALRRAGVIEVVGPSRTGHYQLRGCQRARSV